jgi:hypothetical protein
MGGDSLDRVFDKEITESPMRGYFVMYFFRSDMSRVFLSLNQGWMFFRDTYGLELAKEKISTAARAYRKLLGPIGQFGYESISLGTERELGTGTSWATSAVRDTKGERFRR